MRDPILDRLVQPTVNRWGIAPKDVALNLATLGCALTLVSTAYWMIAGASPIASLFRVILSISILRSTSSAAHLGPSVLNSPLAPIHLIGRLLFLAFGTAGLSQTFIVYLIGLTPLPMFATMANFAGDFASLTISASLFIGACDQPPKRPRKLLTRKEA